MGRKKKESPKKDAASVPDQEHEASPVALHEPFWSVVSFAGRVDSNLTYDEAAKLIAELEKKGKPGLCIVTNAAAQRIKKKAKSRS